MDNIKIDNEPIYRLNVFCQGLLEIAQKLRTTYDAGHVMVDDVKSFIGNEMTTFAESMEIDLRVVQNEQTRRQPVNATEIDDGSADIKRINDLISEAFNDSMTASNLVNISLNDSVLDIAEIDCSMANHIPDNTVNDEANDAVNDEVKDAVNNTVSNLEYDVQDDLNIQAEIIVPVEMNDLISLEPQDDIILLPTSESVSIPSEASVESQQKTRVQDTPKAAIPSEVRVKNQTIQDTAVMKPAANENKDPEKCLNRFPKFKIENKPDMKRRRSMDMRVLAPVAMPIKKRLSAARKSVSFERSQIFFIDSIQMQPNEQVATKDDDRRNSVEEVQQGIVTDYQNRKRNTDIQMHCMNPLYKSHCYLCKRSYPSLAKHYSKEHPQFEVPIARPPPSLAKKLRSNALDFVPDNGKLMGICCFCEELKSMSRRRWAIHLLAHSGEKAYSCATCKMEFDYKTEHVMHKCNRVITEEPIDVFHRNSNGPLVGFMCRDCNYLQVKHTRMIKHLKNEHGYIKPMENHHYRSYTLVPFSPSA